MRILITGALGFVGVNLVRELAAKDGAAIIAADLRTPDNRSLRYLAPVLKHIELVELDVRDVEAVNSLVRTRAVTHIVHAAAITPPDEYEREFPTHVVNVNLSGAVHVLDAAIRCESVQRVLTLSSSGVYGNSAASSYGKQREDGPLTLTNLYAITKYSTELLAERYGQLSGKPMAAVRVGPVFGPMEISSPSRPHTSQPGKLMSALREDRPITVAGPTIARDWTYTADVASALWALLKAPSWHYPTYNLSSSSSILFRQVVEAFVQHGLKAMWVTDAAQADVSMVAHQERLPLDISRLQNDTGFSPRYDIATAVSSCVAVMASISATN